MYYFINIVVSILVIAFGYILYKEQWLNAKITDVGTIALFLILHIFAVIRLYTIFLEKKMNIKRYIGMYLRTEMIQNLLPIPCGFLFRAYNFSYETSGYQSGIIGILVEKTLDIFGAVAILLGMGILNAHINLVTLISVLVIACICLIYLRFEQIYRYLNRFCILHVNATYATKILRILETLEHIHQEIRNIFKGCGMILTLQTVLIYVFRLMILSREGIYINTNSEGLFTWIKYEIYILGAVYLCFIVLMSIGKRFKMEMRSKEK